MSRFLCNFGEISAKYKNMFTNEDLTRLESIGISREVAEAQIERFASGFPYLRLDSAATIGRGIRHLDNSAQRAAMASWRSFEGTIEKFVPASGAASRMFKNLFAFASSGRTAPETDFEREFFEGIRRFAFYPQLNKVCERLYGLNIPALTEAGRHVDVVKALLYPEGMNYGALPKALLTFHRAAAGSTHTPVEEHLEEGAQYAADATRRVRLHFTVSHEHRRPFERLLRDKVPHMEKVWGVTYDISMSEQKPSTDTLAVNMDNTPYRDADGNLLLRPAGHGALIENLNEREADVIFVKNIDNVVPSALRSETTRFKKIIAGVLVDTQRSVAKMLAELEKGDVAHERLAEMLAYLENELSTRNEATASMDDKALADYLKKKLNRPIRVCGMVANQGEPGGGPYLAYNPDGSCSPQVLEAAQINPDDPNAVEMMHTGTHFNPVDLVCYIKDYKGQKFDLKKFVDPDTGLISGKSVGGVEIKALELPGLWNGSMSDWITIFVEVPIATFNPVKTVNDLLREQHQ